MDNCVRNAITVSKNYIFNQQSTDLKKFSCNRNALYMKLAYTEYFVKLDQTHYTETFGIENSDNVINVRIHFVFFKITFKIDSRENILVYCSTERKTYEEVHNKERR